MSTARGLIDDVRAVCRDVDPDGVLVPCGLDTVHIGADELGRVPAELERLMRRAGRWSVDGRRPTVLLLHDPVRIRRDGVDVKAQLATLLAAQFDVRTVVLDDGHPELHASEDVVAAAAAGVPGAAAVVTIGGGTVTDVGKLACGADDALPLLVVQTAASVDGFTDNVSVVLRNGVKRTVPSRWPDVVVADTTLIAQAPARMNRAGFGEITSMFTAPADWRLAALLGFDSGYHPGPIALLAEVGRGIETWSPGLADAARPSVERLVRALDMRGVATGVAGTTACLSGVEHLVSHMLDIANAAHGRPTGLHGAQVGVGSVVAAAAWERLFARLDDAGAPADLAALVPDRDRAREQVQAAFGPLDPTGALADECWRDYARKVDDWHAHLDVARHVLRDWPRHRDELRGLVRSPDRIAADLRAAGSPARFDQLEPGVTPELAEWAVRHCGLMRARFTVVDLLTFLGWWDDGDVAAVLHRADTAGVALGTVRP